jgi:hypothetical protein
VRYSLRYWWAYLWARQYKVAPASSRRYAEHVRELSLAPGVVSYTLWKIRESRRIARSYPKVLP